MDESEVDPLLIPKADPGASMLPEHQDLGVIPGGSRKQEYIDIGPFLEGPRYSLKHCTGGDKF
jgi:hypothetical protein